LLESWTDRLPEIFGGKSGQIARHASDVSVRIVHVFVPQNLRYLTYTIGNCAKRRAVVQYVLGIWASRDKMGNLRAKDRLM
jgi:hypothetical protein